MPKKKVKRKSNRLVAVIFVSAIAIILIACGIAYFVNANHMDEVSTEDDDIIALATRYFRGTKACIGYDVKLLVDGEQNVKDMDYESKEQLAIDYAIRKDYDRIGYDELNEIYHLLFNDGSSLKSKAYYETSSGYYRKNSEVYELTAYSVCSAARPPEMVCLAVDKAYKSDRAIKLIADVYSGAAETGYLYSGIDWSVKPLGVYGDVTPSEEDLAKWELTFKYDNKLKRYFLTSTKKL